ncbi:MAG: glycoside hydrolase family 43 protein [Rikenellaceae bacterium]|nr:glycoside hydrolase family 43 protein [Rikenellaceae bacterium]
MKKILTFLFLAAALGTSAQPYLFSYFTGRSEDGLKLAYSYDGLTWTALNDGQSYLKPEVGPNKLMRDPSVIQDSDGTFHMVWTTGWTDPFIGYANSKDLINWSEQVLLPVMAEEPTVKNTWAPELFYDDKSELFYIIWASTIPDRHSYVAESETEKGLNHRQYYTTTKDFKKFARTEMFFNPDFSVIDGAIIKVGDKYMFVVKNENPNPPEKNLRVTFTDDLEEGFPTEVSAPITGDYWVEGPAPLQVGDYIYIYFDIYREGRYGAVRSKDGIEWEDVSETITFPKGTRHGTAFPVSQEVLETLLNNRK